MHQTLHPLRAALLLLSGAALTACAAATPKTPENPESAEVARLLGQGFALAVDGRGTIGPTALRYQGSPAAVLLCQPPGGRLAASDLAGTGASADGTTVRQFGETSAYVIIGDDGGRRGTYVTHLYRSISRADGTPIANQLEVITFAPGSSGQFRNGVVCQTDS